MTKFEAVKPPAVKGGATWGCRMKKPREVETFPRKGNHVGDLIRLPSGQVYEWIKFKRWQKLYSLSK